MNDVIKLRILDKNGAPEKLLKDILIFKNFPINARENIWDLINAIPEEDVEDKNLIITKYAEKNSVDNKSNLEAVLNALLFIFQNSYSKDLSIQVLSQDLSLLGLEESDITTLVSEYDENRKEYRKKAIIGTMGDHGNLLLDSSWRVAHIQSSDRGRNLNFQIIDLTLSYLKDGGKSNISISLTPQNALELRHKIDEVLNLFSTDVIKINSSE